VNAQHFKGFTVEQDFQHALGLAGNLCTRHALEKRLAHFVRHLGLGQLLLVLADRADLRNGVDAGRHVIDEAPAAVINDAARCRTPLVVGGTGQAWPADYITCGKNVRHGGAVVFINRDLATAIGLDADVFQTQQIGVAGTAIAPEQGVGLDLLAGLEMQDHAVFDAFYPLVLFVVAHGDVVVAEVVAQRLRDLGIEEAQQLLAVIHQLNQHPQTTEDRRVFAADHACPVNNQLTRGVAQTEDGVAIVDTRVSEIDISRAIRTRAGGDNDLLGHQGFDNAVGAHHFDGLLVGEAAGAEEQVDAITCVVTGARSHLLGNNLLGTFQYVREREPARLTNGPKHRIGVELHDLANRVTQGFGRDRAQVRAVAANLTPAIHHCHLAPCFCGVHCRTFSCRAGTQYHYVVVVDSHAYSSEQAVAPLWAPTAKSCRGQRHEGSKRGAQSIEA